MKVLVAQLCLTLCDPMEHARLLCPWNSSDKNIGKGFHSYLQEDLPDPPGIEPGSPALQADSLPSEPPGRPFKSLSLW